MAVYRNKTNNKLSLGFRSLVLPPNSTIVDTEQNSHVIDNIRYYVDKGYLELVSGVPSNALFNFIDLDCSNNPNFPGTNLSYRVSAPGKVGGVSVKLNDILIPIVPNPGGTYAQVGEYWIMLHNYDGSFMVDTIDLSYADYVLPWGVSVVTTQVDVVNSIVLINAAGLVQYGLLANKIYSLDLLLFITNTVNNGIKFSLSTDDTLSFDYIKLFVNDTVINTNTYGVTSEVAALKVTGTFKTAIAGSLRVKIAQNVAHTDTLSLLVGSRMCIQQVHA